MAFKIEYNFYLQKYISKHFHMKKNKENVLIRKELDKIIFINKGHTSFI